MFSSFFLFVLFEVRASGVDIRVTPEVWVMEVPHDESTSFGIEEEGQNVKNDVAEDMFFHGEIEGANQNSW